MSKISLTILFIVFGSSTVFTTPVSADSSVPATEGVCSILKEPGVSKSLFGLCVAYCEAGANSQMVLETYDRKKAASDPDMPCLDVTPEALSCPCWNDLTAEEVAYLTDAENPLAVEPSSCSLGAVDTLTYNPFVLFSVDGGGCAYSNTVTTTFRNLPLTVDEEVDCRAEIYAIAVADFSEDPFTCVN